VRPKIYAVLKSLGVLEVNRSANNYVLKLAEGIDPQPTPLQRRLDDVTLVVGEKSWPVSMHTPICLCLHGCVQSLTKLAGVVGYPLVFK
jgi:hypothetical protein